MNYCPCSPITCHFIRAYRTAAILYRIDRTPHCSSIPILIPFPLVSEIVMREICGTERTTRRSTLFNTISLLHTKMNSIVIIVWS